MGKHLPRPCEAAALGEDGDVVEVFLGDAEVGGEVLADVAEPLLLGFGEVPVREDAVEGTPDPLRRGEEGRFLAGRRASRWK